MSEQFPDYLSPRESLIFSLLYDASDRGVPVTIREVQDACSNGSPVAVSRHSANITLKYLAAKLSMNGAPWRVIRESKPRGRGHSGVFRLGAGS